MLGKWSSNPLNLWLLSCFFPAAVAQTCGNIKYLCHMIRRFAYSLSVTLRCVLAFIWMLTLKFYNFLSISVEIGLPVKHNPVFNSWQQNVMFDGLQMLASICWSKPPHFCQYCEQILKSCSRQDQDHKGTDGTDLKQLFEEDSVNV